MEEGEEVRCVGAAAPPPPHHNHPLTDNPSEFGDSPEPCGGGGVRRVPEHEAHIVAPRDPTSSGLEAQLSRTHRTGAENFQASHW